MRRSTPLLTALAVALIACTSMPATTPPPRRPAAAPPAAGVTPPDTPAPLPDGPLHPPGAMGTSAYPQRPPAAPPVATRPPAPLPGTDAGTDPAPLPAPPPADGPPTDRQALMDEALDFVQAAQEFWQKGELDQALEALDKAYSLILQEDCEEAPKLFQQREDLRYLIAKRILEIYASRNIVVNGQHNAIPRLRNEHVDAELKRFEGPERDFFRAAYQRSGRYRPYFLEALREAGLPERASWVEQGVLE